MKRVFEADPSHLEARINLGRLLHAAGELAERKGFIAAPPTANPCWRSTSPCCCSRTWDASRMRSKAYRETLAWILSSPMRNFNMRGLYERAKDPKSSLRHLLAYVA